MWVDCVFVLYGLLGKFFAFVCYGSLGDAWSNNQQNLLLLIASSIEIVAIVHDCGANESACSLLLWPLG